MIDAVIFDMDGLLVDSEPVWDRARLDMAARLGKDWNKDDHHAIMGTSTQGWVDYMIKRWDLKLSPEEVEDEIAARMVALYEREIPFLPGAVAAVKLASANFPTGLASGSIRKLIDLVTAAPEVADRFRVILSADEVARGKPHPDVYLEAAQRLGVKPDRCVCLEDSSNGILAGKNAGLKVVAVPDPRFPARPEVVAQADVVLGSLEEVSLELLKGL